ncbi:MAG TPA: hemolysin family protein [Pyrinomonadaceae bacterium]|jgi:CBS domain containing-hemolysin-like protein|nr:hemolysin family protein [Pyrinomonadaceae bacterium]
MAATMLSAIYIASIFVLVFLNGFFVAAEFALVGVRRSRIETLAETGDGRARRVINILDNLNAYLSASQLGITLASLGLGWLGEPTVAHLLEGPLTRAGVPATWIHIIAFFVAFSIVTVLHIVLGEQAPKLLGLQRAEGVALWTALPMQLFYRVFSWPVRALDWASARVVRPLGVHATAEHASVYTEEELRRLIDLSHKSGHVEESERRLINRIFEFTDAEVREAMVPRTNVDAIPATATLEEARKAFRQLGYSRLPVYRERLDEVVGVLFRRDLEPYLDGGRDGEFDPARLVHPPLFIPATAKLGSALSQMQSQKTHLAFVIDEHGGLEGIVTLEDLLEEIVGEIDDEYDEETRSQIVEQPDGTFLLDGMLAVRDANRRFRLEIPEDGHYTTVAGFLMAQTGRLLVPGDAVEHAGAVFRVERVDRRRIRWVRFTPPPPLPEEAAEKETANAE